MEKPYANGIVNVKCLMLNDSLTFTVGLLDRLTVEPFDCFTVGGLDRFTFYCSLNPFTTKTSYLDLYVHLISYRTRNLALDN